MTFLGWYDPDKRGDAYGKFSDAVNRYRENFGGEPRICLCNPVEADELLAGGGTHGIVIRAATHIPRHTFYVGVEEDA